MLRKCFSRFIFTSYENMVIYLCRLGCVPALSESVMLACMMLVNQIKPDTWKSPYGPVLKDCCNTPVDISQQVCGLAPVACRCVRDFRPRVCVVCMQNNNHVQVWSISSSGVIPLLCLCVSVCVREYDKGNPQGQ